MYEVDFLPVESDTGTGTKSGDAIAVRFTVESQSHNAVLVVDGGHAATGDSLIEHVRTYYKTSTVDLMVSTHPDADHLNGLATVIEELDVHELLVHRPRFHASNVTNFSNLEALDNLISVAKTNDTTITEPFTGLSRFDGQLLVLGPTAAYYAQLLAEHLLEAGLGLSAKSWGLSPLLLARATKLMERALAYLPVETLTDDEETTPRNNSSVISLLQVDGQRLFLTGDAGIPALTAAAEYYGVAVGDFLTAPLSFFQAPHHGSRHNVGPTVLDRILGPRSYPYNPGMVSFVSSAKGSEKHPSPKVVNALARRGCQVFATEGTTIHHGHDAPVRYGWTQVTPVPPLAED